jgi:hypothetical protein
MAKSDNDQTSDTVALDQRAAELDAREVTVSQREAVVAARETAVGELDIPLENTARANGERGLRSAGGTYEPFAWREEIKLSEDAGYSLDSLRLRAMNMAQRAFSDERVGPVHPVTGMPTFAHLPTEPQSRTLRVTVEVI